ASYKEELAGCVALGKLSESESEMKRLFVREQYRRKGIGRVLCQTLIEQAANTGYIAMRLATALETPRPLYRSLGFKEIEAYRDIPKELKAAHMELELT
ncbi:MAG: GNAT family N-acetyltransferase, partial [Planctomycetota bacterium]